MHAAAGETHEHHPVRQHRRGVYAREREEDEREMTVGRMGRGLREEEE